jgi:nucleotide-binding universal stress UspA family protein
MKQKINFLVCILSDSEPSVRDRYARNAVSFAKHMGADTRFHPLSEKRSIAAVNDAVKQYSCELILIPSGSKIQKDLLEQSQVPVLFLSPQVDLLERPIKSILVPMSGEIRPSAALKLALELASQFNVPIDLLHVVERRSRSGAALESTGDQPHHEYRQLLDEVIAEACPFSEVKERAQVRTLDNVDGSPSTEILKAIEKDSSRALVIEWHGSLSPGKAGTLKEILEHIAVPVFLVRAESEHICTLKIGPEDQVA